MANNRLYLVDTETKEYCCIAKGWDNWVTGNRERYDEFLESRHGDVFGDKTRLIIGSENDDSFYEKWIDHGVNFNKKNEWVTY